MNKLPQFFLVCLVVLFANACSISKIQNQINVAESLGIITGKVKVETAQSARVVVAILQQNENTLTVINRLTASADGGYKFHVLPGDYLIGAFADQNNDGVYTTGEYASFYGEPRTIRVKPAQTVTVDTFTIGNKPLVLPDNIKINVDFKPIIKNIGRIVHMDDPLFNDDNYSMGLWKPVDFLNQVGGGMFLLEEYNKDKIPVLFIHGISGGPHNWDAVIKDLDQEKFQPWVMYYPSGVRLDIISDYMLKAVTDLQRKYAFKQLYLVAHSMGGLVMRSFVKKYREKQPELSKSLKLAMTINSPMKGMASAEWGLSIGFLIIPSWRDVASNSDFITGIHAWSWPKNIPYYLIFSYKTGKSEDGVATLQSQIPQNLQREATKLYGFNADHSGVLSDAEFLARFKGILADSLSH